MLRWTLVLGLCALMAGLLGFIVLAGVLAFAARVLLLLLLALLVMALVSHWMSSAPRAGAESEARTDP